MKKVRADEMLLEAYSLESITLARALIMEGRVVYNGQKVMHPSDRLSIGKEIRVLGEIDKYASRGAHKLKKALEVFDVDIHGKVCIDVGSSTGGFTDVMLRTGAALVYAVDVGYNLLDYRLRSDERVVCLERTNARAIDPEMFSPQPSFGATDVSFISLRLILPPVFSVLRPGSRFIALVKPQFEALQEQVGPGGIVRDPAVHAEVLYGIEEFIDQKTDWKVNGLDYSPIRGTEGNIEFLLDLIEKDNSVIPFRPYSIEQIIKEAYYKLIKSD